MNAPNNGILSTIGFILSAYSVYVEHKIHQHETLDDDEGGFKALCDIDAIGASCRYVFFACCIFVCFVNWMEQWCFLNQLLGRFLVEPIPNVAITYIKSLTKRSGGLSFYYCFFFNLTPRAIGSFFMMLQLLTKTIISSLFFNTHSINDTIVPCSPSPKRNSSPTSN